MKKLLLLCSLIIFGFKAQAFKVYGDSVSFGQGKARVFADIDKHGIPQSIGFAVSEKALEGLPDHDIPQIVLRLPSILQISPYDHMTIQWNAHGHVPEHIYNVPHFDFHFYFIPQSVREAITCSGPDTAVCKKQPPADEIPAYYLPTPDGFPMMGWHFYDPRSPEFNGKPFTVTFIYGFYNGHMTFLEPMMTRDFLMKKESFSNDIPAPQVWPSTGYYPKTYSVQYDSQRKVFFITLTNLEFKNYK
ncbi:MAG: DUF5602 domain-containing protein [Bdellovibrio sp.]